MFNASVRVHRMHGVWNSSGGFELPPVYAAGRSRWRARGPVPFHRWVGRLALDGLAYGLGALATGLVAGLAALAWRAPVAAPSVGEGSAKMRLRPDSNPGDGREERAA